MIRYIIFIYLLFVVLVYPVERAYASRDLVKIINVSSPCFERVGRSGFISCHVVVTYEINAEPGDDSASINFSVEYMATYLVENSFSKKLETKKERKLHLELAYLDDNGTYIGTANINILTDFLRIMENNKLVKFKLKDVSVLTVEVFDTH